MKLKYAIIQAPILRYLDTTKPYIMYTDASDDACGIQLSQMHEETKFPVAYHICSQTPNEDGVHQNKKRTASISPSRNGTTTYKEQTL